MPWAGVLGSASRFNSAAACRESVPAGHFALVLEQPFLAPESAAVTAQRSVRADDAVTRNDEAKHVRAIGAPDRAACSGNSESIRHPGIRPRIGGRNAAQRFPCAQLEIR